MPTVSDQPVRRDRYDRCPGVLRPWPADDGLLVRLRLIGGQVSAATLTSLVSVAETFGDGRVHATSRANLQVRAFPGEGGHVEARALAALETTGLLPSRTHELVRNVMTSPQTGLAGGRIDLRPVSDELDRLICADPTLARLPGKFLFVLDDGRGDLLGQACDLGIVALDERSGQLRVGSGWGMVIPLDETASVLAGLAGRFVDHRGEGPSAPWHVDELAAPMIDPSEPDPRLPTVGGPLPYGVVPGGTHIEVPESGLDARAIQNLAEAARQLVVTPWRGILIPNTEQ
ncbi:MAG: precorrin-3B synthase [Nostocoides sp.]